MSRHDRFSLLLFASLVLGGCATTGGQPSAKAPPAKSDAAVADQEKRAEKPRAMTADSMFAILAAEFALQDGNYPLAAEYWQRAAQLTPDPRVLARATRTLARVGRLQDALTLAKRWAELAPQQPEPLHYQASILISMGHKAAGTALLERLTQRFPDDLDAYLLLSEVLSSQKQNAKAAGVLQSYLKTHEKDAVAWFALGRQQLHANQAASAAASFKKAVDNRPAWQEAALAVSLALSQSQGDPAAEQYLRAYLAKHPDAHEVSMQLATVLLREDHWDEAHAIYQSLYRQQPDNPNLALALGLIDMQRKDWAGAETYFTKALELVPQQSLIRYYLGRLQEEQGRYPQALRWYGQIEAGPFFPEAQLHMAVAEQKLGRTQAAQTRLKDLARRYPELTQVPLVQAEFALQEKRPQQALAVINAALNKNPRQPDLLYQRAAIFQTMKHFGAMEHDMREVIRINPNNAQAYNFLGYSLLERGQRLDEAGGLLRKALALAPNDPYILDSMGWYFYKTGNYREAEQYLRRALAQQPGQAEVSAHLGDVLQARGRAAEARQIWREALQRHPGNVLLKERLKQ